MQPGCDVAGLAKTWSRVHAAHQENLQGAIRPLLLELSPSQIGGGALRRSSWSSPHSLLLLLELPQGASSYDLTHETENFKYTQAPWMERRRRAP